MLPWKPRYRLTPAMGRDLMTIEAARTVVDHTPLPLAAEVELRRRARIRSSHYSTAIEGNRLTLAQAEKVIASRKARFHGRERDVQEVRNYWNALIRMEEWAAQKRPLNENLIRRIHAIVEKGLRAKPTPYRTGQNVIRDSGSGRIVYLPPEARDVPALMRGLADWVRRAEKEGIPVPLIAGLVHYQLVTIHPYYDGNGRTARLLATFLLHRGGYGLNGFLSLEEHHARDLEGYYRSLAVHPHHNYYHGRAQADLTRWLAYFSRTLATVFENAKQETLHLAKKGFSQPPEPLRKLDRRAKAILPLFLKTDRLTNAAVREALGLSDRMTRVLLTNWVKDGWLKVANASNRARAYGLSAIYRQYLKPLSAMQTK
jgi:Fic family protein